MIQDIVNLINVSMITTLIVYLFTLFYMYKYKTRKKIWKTIKTFIIIGILLNIIKLIFESVLQQENVVGTILIIGILLVDIITVEVIIKK